MDIIVVFSFKNDRFSFFSFYISCLDYFTREIYAYHPKLVELREN